jgi:hypothetical protein
MPMFVFRTPPVLFDSPVVLTPVELRTYPFCCESIMDHFQSVFLKLLQRSSSSDATWSSKPFIKPVGTTKDMTMGPKW